VGPMEDAIAAASSGWDGNEPRFILIQAQPWQDVTPTSFKTVKNSLDSNHIVIRPDQLFQLIREANGLPVNPGCDTVASAPRGKSPVKNLVLYPNPANDRLYIVGLKSTAFLEVYNSVGQSLLRGTGTSINVSSLRAGTYFIRVTVDYQSQTYTFLKK